MLIPGGGCTRPGKKGRATSLNADYDNNTRQAHLGGWQQKQWQKVSPPGMPSKHNNIKFLHLIASFSGCFPPLSVVGFIYLHQSDHYFYRYDTLPSGLQCQLNVTISLVVEIRIFNVALLITSELVQISCVPDWDVSLLFIRADWASLEII